MNIQIEPIINEPALLVSGKTTSLVVGDIHLGIEWDLYRSGVTIPSQMEAQLVHLLGLIRKHQPHRLILLGDIKHNVPQISWQERDEIPRFFEALTELVQVDLLPGNHDGGIEFLLPESENITIHPSRGAVIDNVGYFHGHTWPDAKILGEEYVIMAHNHPTVRFTDPLGYSISEPVWIRTSFIGSEIQKHFNKIGMNIDHVSDTELIIVPVFNELCGGIAFNEARDDDLLGPVFSARTVEVNNARVYLLDGTYLGLLKNIRKLEDTRVREKPRRKKRFNKDPVKK